MEPFSFIKAARGEYQSRKTAGQCEQHGAFEFTEYLGYDGEVIGKRGDYCTKCNAVREAAEKEREAEMERSQRLTTAKIQKRFWHCALENYQVQPENEKQLRHVEDYIQRWPAQLKTGESLLLLGNVGTGKTHLAVAILRHILGLGQRGRYATAMELLREVRLTWRDKGEHTEAQIIQHFGETPLLVLDEVGVQNGSDNERVILFDVLNERYERMLPTVVAGNVTVEELNKCLDERTVDRLRDNGGKALVFAGKSHRRAA